MYLCVKDIRRVWMSKLYKMEDIYYEEENLKWRSRRNHGCIPCSLWLIQAG